MRDYLLMRLRRLIFTFCEKTPYYHLDGYMRRWWLLGARSIARNQDSPQWDASTVAHHAARSCRLYQWLTARLAIRLHEVLRSDNDRHLHDHPCWNISIVLSGGYWEHVPRLDHAAITDQTGIEITRALWRGPGSIVFRRAAARHRLELPTGKTCWSIFILGRKSQSWGFYTPDGKIGWREYLASAVPQARSPLDCRVGGEPK